MSRRGLLNVGIVALLFGALFLKVKEPNQIKDSILIWIESPPVSSDPIQFDTVAHHVVFGSVLGTLVDFHTSGKITPLLAERWEASPDYCEWKFWIRNGLQFSDGSPILAQSVVLSWTRLAFITKNQGSHSELLHNILGIEDLNSPTGKMRGLRSNGQELIIKLKKPLPNLLELVSFGLYSIVHPSNFDSKTGNWEASSPTISSSFYEVADWSQDEITLTLRMGFIPELRHPYAFRSLNIVWSKSSRAAADLVYGFSSEAKPHSGMIFHGGPKTNIAYAYCISWNNPRSPCSNIEWRRQFRREFLLALREHGIQSTSSFFPKQMQDIQEPDAGQFVDRHFESFGNIHLTKSTSSNPLLKLFEEISPEAARKVGCNSDFIPLRWSDFDQIVDSNFKRRLFDISAMYTGINYEDPLSDIRFMFMSREGIRLPDADGRIFNELKKEQFSPQKVNELLWEQAIVWPIGHFALGFWSIPEIDFSRVNLLLPPTSLYQVGLNAN